MYRTIPIVAAASTKFPNFLDHSKGRFVWGKNYLRAFSNIYICQELYPLKSPSPPPIDSSPPKYLTLLLKNKNSYCNMIVG